MISGIKKFCCFFTVILLILAVGLGMAVISANGDSVGEDTLRADKTLKVTYTIPENIISNSFKIGVNLFDWVGTEVHGKIADAGFLAYDVYSPTPVCGIGGLSPKYDGNTTVGGEVWNYWEENYPDGKTDSAGNDALSSADLSKVIANGWYERVIPLGAAAKEGGISNIIAVLDTSENVSGQTLEVYFKNARIIAPDGSVQAYLFFGKTAELEVKGGKDWVPFQSGDTSYNGAVGVSAAYVEKPDLQPLNLTVEPIFLNGEEIDLLNIVNLNGNLLKSVFVYQNGVQLKITDNKFTASVGEYLLHYKTELSANIKYDFYAEITVLDGELLLTPDPLKNFLKEYASDTRKIMLPVVYGKIDGVDTEAQIIVTDASGADITGSAIIKQGKEYCFNVSDKGNFIIKYKLCKEEKTVFTKPATITVGLIEYTLPQSFSDGTAAEVYSLHDLQNGAQAPVAINKIEVFNPLERKESLNIETAFIPSIAGKHSVKVYVTDSRFGTDNKVFTAYFNVKETENMPIKISVAVPKEQCGEGVEKQVVIRLFEKNQFGKLSEGDVFSYDLFMPIPIKGVGLVSFMGDGSKDANGGADGDWEYFATWDNWKADGESKDKIGLDLYGEADLTSKLIDSAQKPVWYHREISVPAAWQKPILDMAFEIKTNDAIQVAAGEEFGFIESYIQNAQIIKADGTKIDVTGDSLRPKLIPQIPSGRQYLGDNVNEVWSNDWVNPAASVSYSLSPTAALNTSFLPQNRMITCGEAFTIPEGVLYNYKDFKAATVTSVLVVDSAGQEYTVKEMSFLPKRTGEYRIKVQGTDTAGIFGECVFSLYADANIINETTQSGYSDLLSAITDLAAKGNVLYIRGGEYTQELLPLFSVTIYTDANSHAEIKGKFNQNVIFGANVSPFKFSVTVTGGSADFSSAEFGREVTLTATAPIGKKFKEWRSQDVTVMNNKFIMPVKGVNLEAVFEDIVYNITVSGGSYEGSATYGSKIVLVASEPPAGKVFVRWEANGVTIENNEFVMAEGDVTVTAVYEDVKKGCNSMIAVDKTPLIAMIIGLTLLGIIAIRLNNFKTKGRNINDKL